MTKPSKMNILKMISIFFVLYIVLNVHILAQNNSSWMIDSSVLNLPFRGENNLYYTLFPGVTSQDFRGNDLLHIRGSRHDELAYYINGIDIRSDYTGLPLFRIIPQALDNITIDKAPGVGTSGARAAIAHELKQGGDKYIFSLNGETDRFTPIYDKRLDTYSYGYNNLTLTGGGTIPKIGTEIFIAGEKESFADHYRMFWDGFHITDKDMNLEFITNVTWTEVDTGYIYSFDILEDIDELLIKPGNIPKANLGRTTLNGVITQPFPNGSIALVALYENETKRVNNTPIRHLFNQKRLPETNRKAQLYSLQGEYNFPLDIKLKLQADFMRSNESTYDPNFGDDFWKYADSIALVSKDIPYYRSYGKTMRLHQFSFDMPGNLISGYEKREESYSNIHLDLSKTLNNHIIKFGGNIKNGVHRYYNISNYALRALEMFYNYHDWTRNTVPHDVFNRQLFWSRVQGVGYNLEGQTVDRKGAYYEVPKKPKHLSFYLSDTYTKDKWKLEIGLRYDSFYSDAFVIQDSAIVDYGYAYFDYYYGFTGNEPLEKQQTYNILSPRLHIAHQINNSISVFSKFGKYVQFPQLGDVYTNKVSRLLLVNGQNFITDLRSNDTKPVETNQVTMGINYSMEPYWNINAEIFGVAGSNYLQTDNITLFNSGEPSNNYPVFKAKGTSQTVGLELDLQYNTDKIDAMLNYSYSYAKGTSSHPISNYPFTWNAWDTTNYNPADYELEHNNKHSVVGFFAYKYGIDENIFLKNTIISMVGRFDSGHPYILWDGGFG